MNNAWLVRPRPHRILRINDFLCDGFVATGWPGLGNLSGKSCGDIRHILSGTSHCSNRTHLGFVNAALDIIVNRMETGDLVVVPNGKDIFFGKVCSDYIFEPAADTDQTGYAHRRKVEWLQKRRRDDLTMDLRRSLVSLSVANLTHHFDEIHRLAH